MPAQIFLIRHGETEWALSGRHTGRTDVPLTENGERAAAQLREPLHRAAFSHILTSPRLRARRTCELAGFGDVARVEPDLQEWDYGSYEGLTKTEIRARQPAWNIYQDGCPEGESAEQISRRADRVVAHLRTLQGTVAIFSHGHFLRVLAVRWIGFPLSAAQHLALDTASLSILGYETREEIFPVISRWNTTASTP